MLTAEQFRKYLDARNEKESLEAIGRSLGVSCVAVHRWLSKNRKPTKTVLMLAERLIEANAGQRFSDPLST